MLKISNLTKSFDANIIFDSIDFEIEKGDVSVIVGPSGTGKSTLLRCLNLLEKPDSGLMELNNRNIDLSTVNKDEIQFIRENISMVFQSFNLYRNKTALENITEPLLTVKKINKKKANEKAEYLLDKVGLLNKKDKYPATLSGGEQQRVGIARAMGMDSDIILFDEPTSSLDPTLVSEVLNVIKDLAKEDITMIIVTHEMKFAKEIADTVIFMSDGEIVEKTTSDVFFNNPQDPRAVRFLENMI